MNATSAEITKVTSLLMYRGILIKQFYLIMRAKTHVTIFNIALVATRFRALS